MICVCNTSYKFNYNLTNKFPSAPAYPWLATSLFTSPSYHTQLRRVSGRSLFNRKSNYTLNANTHTHTHKYTSPPVILS